MPLKGKTSSAKGKKQGTGARSPRTKKKKDALPPPLSQREQNAVLAGVPLTNGRRRFVEEYIIDGNTLEAGARAGFSDPRYAFQLLSDPIVNQAIAIAKARRVERTQITADKTLRELAWIGYCDPAEANDPVTGNLLPLHEMPEHLRHALAGFDVKRRTYHENGQAIDEEIIKVRFWPKTEALLRLGKAQGVPLGADGSFQFNFNSTTVNVCPEGSHVISAEQLSRLPQHALDALMAVLEDRQPPTYGLKELPAPLTIESTPADDSATATDGPRVRGGETGRGNESSAATDTSDVPTADTPTGGEEDDGVAATDALAVLPQPVYLPDQSNTTHIPGTVAD